MIRRHRVVIVRVDGRACNPAGLECLEQSLLLNQRSARGIQDKSASRQGLQLSLANDSPCSFRQWHREYQEIEVREKLLFLAGEKLLVRQNAIRISRPRNTVDASGRAHR